MEDRSEAYWQILKRSADSICMDWGPSNCFCKYGCVSKIFTRNVIFPCMCSKQSICMSCRFFWQYLYRIVFFVSFQIKCLHYLHIFWSSVQNVVFACHADFFLTIFLIIAFFVSFWINSLHYLHIFQSSGSSHRFFFQLILTNAISIPVSS